MKPPARMLECASQDIYIDAHADTNHDTVLLVIADRFVRLTRPDAENVAKQLSPDRRLTK